MSRFFEDVLLVDEESGAAAWHGRQGLLQGDAGSLAKRFLTLGADLCLVAGAPCRTPEVAAVVVAAWRAGVRIVELGPAPSELAPLAGERVDGSTEELLEDLWDRFLGDGADHALNKGVDRLGRHTP
ncbi:MAG: hypothetical protein Q8O14_12495 [bacterium]|jgi:hypothetical protein|nr:hypothetical protein [bacterium]